MTRSPLSIEDIRKAKKTIAPYLSPTPLTRSFYLSNKYDLNIYLKMENLNLSGSFKIRGATNAILSADQKLLREKGIVAVSAGNHAQGVARTANMLGVHATVFMPKQAPLVKIETTKNLGAHVILEGNTYDEAESAARRWNEEKGALLVHPFEDTEVIAGQGTIGLEIIDEIARGNATKEKNSELIGNHDVGAVILPIGGGGLASGVACAVKSLSPQTKIIGVQTNLYNTIARRFNDDPSECKNQLNAPSLADGIAVKGVSDYTYAQIVKYVDEIVSVSEDEIAAAIMELMERDHLLAEGAGVVSVAALEQLSEQLRSQIKQQPVVCVLSGGNIDVSLLNRITKKGLLYSGRIMRLNISLPDQPGALVSLLSKVSDTGANLYNIEHNRVFSGYGVKNVDIVIDLETINKDHQDEIIKLLQEGGYVIKP